MACTFTKSHTPAAPASDHHHVIPRAWQVFYRPPPVTGPNGATMTLGAGPLWDNRTVEVCPNHHRLVHEAIVDLMRQRATSARGIVLLTAQLALDRFTQAGGDLDALRASGHFGEQ